MRLAAPGHGGSRLRVRTRYAKNTTWHHGVVERRVGPFWLTIGSVCGETPVAALRNSREVVAKWENRTKKVATYL